MGGREYFLKVSFSRCIFIDLTKGQFRESVDGRQNIIEIMRNAAGQCTHGFHFLALDQLPLHLTFPGDVPNNDRIVFNLLR